MQDDELEKEIDRKKQQIKDYREIAELFNYKKEIVEIQTNLMLEDLYKLMKKRK